jgi:hypothetical protein
VPRLGYVHIDNDVLVWYQELDIRVNYIIMPGNVWSQSITVPTWYVLPLGHAHIVTDCFVGCLAR